MSRFTPLTEELHSYLVDHAREDEVLRRVREETSALGEISVMQISPDQGAFMTVLARLLGTRLAIELGTFTGYSAICIARGLEPDGRLVACELDPRWAEVAAGNVESAGLADRVEIRLGPALETVREMPREPELDLAFIDADKTGYPDYFEELLPRMRPGGLVVLDNALMDGRVLDPLVDDEGARTIVELNRRLAADERIDFALVSVADGLALARKR